MSGRCANLCSKKPKALKMYTRPCPFCDGTGIELGQKCAVCIGTKALIEYLCRACARTLGR